MRLDAFALIGAIGIDVAAVYRGHGVAAVDGLLDRPDIGLRAPAGVRGTIAFHAFAVRGHPSFGQRHERVLHDRVVAVEIQSQEHRRRPGTLIG